MNEKLKEFIERNKGTLKEYKETMELSDFPEGIPVKIFPIEYQEFIEKWEKKVDEINQIKDVNKKSSVLLKSLVEELKEKGKLYDYLDEIYKELKAYKLSNRNNSLSDYWDYFISDAIENLEEYRTPLQRYLNIELSIIKKEKINFPVKELEKILNPICIEKTITSDLIREIRQKIRNSLIRRKSNLEKLKSEDKNETIKEYEELAEKEDEFIKRLKGEKIYLFYFKHNLKISGEYDWYLTDDLITSYISQQINIKEDYIYPIFDKAFVKNDNIENIGREVFFNGATEEDINLKSFYDVAVNDIFGILLNKFQLEAEQKRKEQKEKEKRAEKFYKSYEVPTQIFIPHLISRNNPFLLKPVKLLENEEIKLNSYWGYAIIKALSESEMMDPADAKNIISIYAIIYSIIKYLKREGLNEDEIANILTYKGMFLPLPLIAEVRGINKRKENYLRIIESIIKARNLEISGKLSVNIKGKSVETKRGFSLISEYEEIRYKNKLAVNIYLSRTPAQLLMEEKGRAFNRKILNNISDATLPLYLYLENMRIDNKKDLIVRKDTLLANSRLAYGKTAKERPDKLDKLLSDKLNELKDKKIIRKWKKEELYDGLEGVKIFFEK